MHTINFSPLAINDLLEIKEYISVELDDKDAAKRISTNILTKIENLAKFPLLGENLESKIDVSTNYRYLVCESYIAFYRVENNIVYIIRILYGKSDYLRTLFG